MNSLKRNIVANFVGRTWSTIIGLIFVPVYIHFIGIEAYGLLGIFSTIQVVLSLLDMGLSTTLNREVATHVALQGEKQYINNLVFSMERIYYLISILSGIFLIIISWFFATKWVNTEKLSNQTVITAFMLMAVNFVCQFPASLYQGAMLGLQKQVVLNVIQGSISTVKALGALFVLAFLSPTITSFLIWQVLLSILQFFLLRKYLWKNLPLAISKPHFDRNVIKKSGRYAFGIMGISVLSIILTQSDKIILSKMVKLTEFGYYSLAATVAASLTMVMYPITSAIFPKMTELINKKKQDELIIIFHQASQLVALIIIPMAVCLFIFAEDIVLAWTRSIEIANNAGPILRFLILGSGINCLMTIPYQFTLSVGWLRYGLNVSIVAIIFFLPFIFFAAYRYGALGSAFMWMILNMAYFILAMLYLFSKYFNDQKWKWYLVDNARPLLFCIIFALPFFIIHENFPLKNIHAILLFGISLSTCYFFTLWFGTPQLKPQFINFLRSLKGRIPVKGE